MKTLNSLIAGLRPACSIIPQRIAIPLLHFCAGLVLIHPCAGQSGTWSATGSLATARAEYPATLPSNGKVLVAGGQGQLTIRVLKSFNYPGSGNATVEGINDHGDVVGYFENGTGAVRGFIRSADGAFSAPIVEPNDTGNVTVAKDINNLGGICGYYFSSDIYHPYRGFILADTMFTEYGPGGSDYYLNGINDAGDFCATLDFHYLIEGLLQLAEGGQVYFNVGNSAEANAINVHAEIVGNYNDGQNGFHGFFRVQYPEPSIRSPFDYPDSISTVLLGLNDSGHVIVGKYVDSVGAMHGLILQRPTFTFTSFDYPGAIETSLNAINNHKVVAGYYADTFGIHHGFIAKVIESGE